MRGIEDLLNPNPNNYCRLSFQHIHGSPVSASLLGALSTKVHKVKSSIWIISYLSRTNQGSGVFSHFPPPQTTFIFIYFCNSNHETLSSLYNKSIIPLCILCSLA